MRLRATTVHATNQNDYLKQVAANEQAYFDNFNLPAFGLISLEDDDQEDEYRLLSRAGTGVYRVECYERSRVYNRRKNMRKALHILPMFRKRINIRKKRNSAAATSTSVALMANNN